MTVRELIAKLQAIDNPNLPVCVPCEYGEERQPLLATTDDVRLAARCYKGAHDYRGFYIENMGSPEAWAAVVVIQ